MRPTKLVGSREDLRNTPAMYASEEAKALKRAYRNDGPAPMCPRCATQLEVTTGWKARFLITELSCQTCLRCVMFRPTRE